MAPTSDLHAHLTMAQSKYPLDGSVRHHFPSFSVARGQRSPEECRTSSHWRGARGFCVFCGLPLQEDGSEVPPSTTPEE